VLLASLLVSTLLIAIDATSMVLVVSTITIDLGGNATESFWIGASYLLAMCMSQPIMSRLSEIFQRRSIILASIMMLGIGSLVCESAGTIALLLVGRTIQGFGAGGLTVLSYGLYGDLEARDGLRFLSAISLFIAAGTVCGPLIGAALSNGHLWRWIFRLNIPPCLLLGVVVFNTSDVKGKASRAAKFSDLDFIAVALFVSSVVPLLVGLSFAGSLYNWKDWQVIVPLAFGSITLLLLICREMIPSIARSPFRRKGAHKKPLLGLRLLRSLHGAATFGGAMFLGVLMYALLFFLPIYYRIIKEKSAIATSLFLLSQTLMMAPCASIVLVLVRVLGISYRWTVLLGWFCTTCGIGLLALLGADRTATSDVLLNLVSGFGIGVLLPALALSAKDNAKDLDALEAPMVLVFMRYLGSASGLVLVGLVFQRVLRDNLGSTKFKNEADEMTKYASTLMYSIREMSTSQDKQTLIQATEKTLRTIWLALSAGSFLVLLLSCVMVIFTMKRK
ncbi:major facilitator superfamily domain-containing protein, partial [Phaeosphaeriaceae sp. PMI808]